VGKCILLLILSPLFLLAQVSSPNNAQDNVQPLTQAQQAALARAQAAAQADQISTAIGASSNGETTQTTNQISIYEASLDNFINTQKAREISRYMSQELENQAGAAYGACSPANSATDPDCYLSSTLMGMRDVTSQSSTSFNQAHDVAWHDVCVFSSIPCARTPPNFFANSLASQAAFTQDEVEAMNEGLISRGFIVNPRTGVVQVPGSKVINPSSPESLRKNLGETQTKELLEKIKSMEKTALKKVAKITKKEIAKKLGLNPSGQPYQPSLAAHSSYSDQTSLTRYPSSEPKQPAKLSIDEQMIGMSTSYRGEPVGVAKDSIFRMIQFRYQVKANQRSFLSVP
jgi:hypothetical protein